MGWEEQGVKNLYPKPPELPPLKDSDYPEAIIDKAVDEATTAVDAQIAALGSAVNTIDAALTSHVGEIAATDTLGHVKVDGVTISIDGDGVISAGAPTPVDLDSVLIRLYMRG